MQLQGKTALITGATTGIGRATAEQFIREGVKALVITGQDDERLSAAARELNSGNVPVTAVKWRAEYSQDNQTLLDRVQGELGHLDILFANAGVTWPASVDQLDTDSVQAQMLINFTAPLMLVKTLAPAIAEGGSVIFNTSCLDVLGMPGMTVYAASKAALRSATRTLSAEFGQQGIRVNAVAPGPIETPIYSKLGMSEEQLSEMASGIVANVPAGRFGKPEEVAAAVLFLASDSSSYMRGAEIEVDGGWTTL